MDQIKSYLSLAWHVVLFVVFLWVMVELGEKGAVIINDLHVIAEEIRNNE